MTRGIRLLVVGLMVVSACSGTGSEGTTSSPQSTVAGSGSSGSDTSTTAPTDEVDPCGFLSDVEMSGILGLTVTAAATTPITCDYGSAGSSGGISLNVESVAGSGCEPVFDLAGYGSDGGESVDGVGSYAKFGDGFVPQLAVCFHDQLTMIASLGAESSDPRATLIAVAQGFEANIP